MAGRPSDKPRTETIRTALQQAIQKEKPYSYFRPPSDDIAHLLSEIDRRDKVLRAHGLTP